MPTLLDLFCGAGGAAEGYSLAGFDTIIGVDIKHQPRYPFEFHKLDWEAGLAQFGADVDAIHASPPCQAYSRATHARGAAYVESLPRLIVPVRLALQATGKPYVIENVETAPLRNWIMLCGHMFDLPLYRHRRFENNWGCTAPEHEPHTLPAAPIGKWTPDHIITVAGNVHPIEQARLAMGIDWMSRHELVESVPPRYTEWVGRKLVKYLAAAPTSI
jgi:DNA (cytosine-5)-methyltransferase 1